MYCGPLKWIVASKMKNINLENIYLAMDPVCLGRFFIVKKNTFWVFEKKDAESVGSESLCKKSWSTIQTQAWV